jgi:hypothetical protein
MLAALRRFFRRAEAALWQDLHPLHSGYFITVIALLGLVAVILLGMAAWMMFAP